MEPRVILAVVGVCATLGWSTWLLRGSRRRSWRVSAGDGRDGRKKARATALIDGAIASPASHVPVSVTADGVDASRADSVEPDGDMPDPSGAALVKEWAHNRACVACGGTVVESRFSGHHIALLEPSGMTREWVDVAADRLPLALATSLPMCWNCHVAATFRRTHPELVTDREDRSVRVSEES